MKTAMQELIEFTTLSSMQYPIGEILAKAHQLLEKEKEQIIKAVNDTWHSSCSMVYGRMPTPIDGNDYYNETFLNP